MPHRGRARIDHAVEDQLDADDPHPRVGGAVGELDRTVHLREVRLQVARVGDDPVRGDADRQFAAVPLLRALQRGEAVLVEGHVDHSRDAGREIGGDGAVEVIIPTCIGGRRIAVRPCVMRRRGLVEQARRLARDIPCDLTADRVASVPPDTELGERCAVDPARVVVIGIEIDGDVGDRGVDHGASGAAARAARSRAWISSSDRASVRCT